MGQVLSSPIEVVRVQKQRGAIATVAVAEMQGYRDNHEDAHFMSQPEANGWASFGVLDGHGGWLAARKAADKLPIALKKATKGRKAADGPGLGKMQQAFEDVDAELRAEMGTPDPNNSMMADSSIDQSGSTIVAGLAKQNHQTGKYSCFIANAGDSRGLIVRLGFGAAKKSEESTPTPAGAVEVEDGDALDLDEKKSSEGNVNDEAGNDRTASLREKAEDDNADKKAATKKKTEGDKHTVTVKLSGAAAGVISADVLASVDHKPSRADELARIENAGGMVSGLRGGGFGDCPRVDGNLAVSRGFADFQYKLNDKLKPGEQKVSPVPELFSCHDLEYGDLMLLACDGIFDVMSNEELTEFVVSNYLRLESRHSRREDLLGELCQLTVSHCLANESKDNMTMMIVQLGSPKDYAPVVPASAEGKDSRVSTGPNGAPVVVPSAEAADGGKNGAPSVAPTTTVCSGENSVAPLAALPEARKKLLAAASSTAPAASPATPVAVTDKSPSLGGSAKKKTASGAGAATATPTSSSSGPTTSELQHGPQHSKLPTFEQEVIIPNLQRSMRGIEDSHVQNTYHEFFQFCEKYGARIDPKIAKSLKYRSALVAKEQQEAADAQHHPHAQHHVVVSDHSCGAQTVKERLQRKLLARTIPGGGATAGGTGGTTNGVGNNKPGNKAGEAPPAGMNSEQLGSSSGGLVWSDAVLSRLKEVSLSPFKFIFFKFGRFAKIPRVCLWVHVC
eukprot:g2607.t1